MATRIFQPPESAPTSPSICASSIGVRAGLRARGLDLVAPRCWYSSGRARNARALRLVEPRLERDQLVMQIAEASAAGDRFIEDRAPDISSTSWRK